LTLSEDAATVIEQKKKKAADQDLFGPLPWKKSSLFFLPAVKNIRP
jgi:hypothetical protein